MQTFGQNFMEFPTSSIPKDRTVQRIVRAVGDDTEFYRSCQQHLANRILLKFLPLACKETELYGRSCQQHTTSKAWIWLGCLAGWRCTVAALLPCFSLRGGLKSEPPPAGCWQVCLVNWIRKLFLYQPQIVQMKWVCSGFTLVQIIMCPRSALQSVGFCLHISWQQILDCSALFFTVPVMLDCTALFLTVPVCLWWFCLFLWWWQTDVELYCLVFHSACQWSQKVTGVSSY